MNAIRKDGKNFHYEPNFLESNPLVFGFTLDQFGSRDRENAFFLSQQDVNNAVHTCLDVSISDVSSIVHPNGKQDVFARQRGFSFWNNGKTAHMLHKDFALGTGSLLPQERRAALTFRFPVLENGNLCDVEVFRSTIEIQRHFTHEQAIKALDGKGKQAEVFCQLIETAKTLRKNRKGEENGVFSYDEKNTFQPRPMTDVHILAEEFMIEVNRRVAKMMYEIGIPFLYRNSQEGIVSYSETPTQHDQFGIPYAQITSPLRCYADLLNLRILSAYVNNEALPYTNTEIKHFVYELNAIELRNRNT